MPQILNLKQKLSACCFATIFSCIQVPAIAEPAELSKRNATVLIRKGSRSMRQDLATSKLICRALRQSTREDRIQVISCKQKIAIIEVNYVFGIGSVQLQFQRNYRPLVLELHFKNFKMMESFEIANANTKYSASLKNDGQIFSQSKRVKQRATHGIASTGDGVSKPAVGVNKPADIQSHEAHEAGDAPCKTGQLIKIEMRKNAGEILVSAPCAQLVGADGTLQIDWIDAYR